MLKHALARGRASAPLTAAGILAADLIWALASVVGLTALLVSSQTAFDVVRYLGALYLICLRLVLSQAAPLAGDEPAAAPARTHHLRGFRGGLVSDRSNPKTVIVFTSVIPQLLHAGASPGAALVLGITFSLIGFAGLVLHTLVFGAAAGALRNARVTRAILRVGGSLLDGVGIGLAAERPARA